MDNKKCKHGMYGTPTYGSWSSLRSRCNDKNHHKYKRYGGRGITVCDSWNEFINFHKDMGTRPDGTTIDRIDNNKGYSPDNCRWATREEQDNNKSNNRYIEWCDIILTASQWSRVFEIPRKRLAFRLWRGKSVEETMTTTKYGLKYLDIEDFKEN